MNGSALMIVFPFEDRLHDYGHVQAFLHSLFMIIDATFLSYTSVFLFSRRTEHILAASRRMAWDAEIVLSQTHAPWYKRASSPRFACSTMHSSVPPQKLSVVSSCDADVCVQEDQMQVNGTIGTEALGADGVPLMVAVAIGATGKCRRLTTSGIQASHSIQIIICLLSAAAAPDFPRKFEYIQSNHRSYIMIRPSPSHPTSHSPRVPEPFPPFSRLRYLEQALKAAPSQTLVLNANGQSTLSAPILCSPK